MSGWVRNNCSSGNAHPAHPLGHSKWTLPPLFRTMAAASRNVLSNCRDSALLAKSIARNLGPNRLRFKNCHLLHAVQGKEPQRSHPSRCPDSRPSSSCWTWHGSFMFPADLVNRICFKPMDCETFPMLEFSSQQNSITVPNPGSCLWASSCCLVEVNAACGASANTSPFGRKTVLSVQNSDKPPGLHKPSCSIGSRRVPSSFLAYVILLEKSVNLAGGSLSHLRGLKNFFRRTKWYLTKHPSSTRHGSNPLGRSSGKSYPNELVKTLFAFWGVSVSAFTARSTTWRRAVPYKSVQGNRLFPVLGDGDLYVKLWPFQFFYGIWLWNLTQL